MTRYAVKSFEPSASSGGIFRYHQWLPILRGLAGAGATVTYRSEKLCHLTGLPNLWIAFNGYWPERGATLETASFKELEAYTVIPRIPEGNRDILVVASAGNTAAAFAHVCSRAKIPCLIIVPAHGLQRMRFAEPLDSCVRVVSLAGLADYYEAISFANRIAQLEGFFPEGGVKNVARRDGLGTMMLSAVETIGQIPVYYFQAIGSGAGAIAVHESSKKLIGDGRYGDKLPRLMLSQNLPFAPIYDSWKAKSKELIRAGRDEAKRQIREVAAPVLSNWQPPYSIEGGVFDVLHESGGDMLVADNDEVRHATRLFEECEGIDIDAAAGVALATLLKAASNGLIEKNALTLLNITGGGALRRAKEHALIPVEPDKVFMDDETSQQRTVDEVLRLF